MMRNDSLAVFVVMISILFLLMATIASIGSG